MTDSKQLATEIRETILNQKELIKRASSNRDEALAKAAQLEEEVRILRDVLELVSKSVIDPRDAASKVAEFLQNPQDLEVLKQAHLLGFDSPPRIGVPVSDEKPRSEDAAAPLVELLQEIESKLKRV